MQRINMKQNTKVKETKGAGSKHCNDSKAFIEYSNDTDDRYRNIEEYDTNKEHKC